MSIPQISKCPKRMATLKGCPKGKLAFRDLPFETQKEIFAHVSRKDLLSLQRVSQHFFGLASAEIYRVLDFNFTSSDASNNGTPTSRIADAIQAVVASDQDYGQHIKSFRFGISEDANPDAVLMIRVLWDSVADPSKVLNTLILLMVRKAQMMETFQWETPIELSGNVYRALHKAQNLRHLRIRLDVPATVKTTVHQTFPPAPPLAPTHTPSSQLAAAYSLASTSSATSFSTTTKLRKLQKKKLGVYDYWANGRVFSGFRNLCSLSLLGISNLDCLQEISECLKASSTSLRSLTLSLSCELARKARLPSTMNHAVDETSDTDPDGEDEDIVDASMPHAVSAGQPANEADARKEKLAQEAILAKIFDLQTVVAEGKKLEKSIMRPPVSSPSSLFLDPSSNTRDGKTVLKTFLDMLSGELEKDPRDVLEILRIAAEKYLNTHPKEAKGVLNGSTKSTALSTNKLLLTSKPADSSMQDFGSVEFEKDAGDWLASDSAALSSDWNQTSVSDGWASDLNGVALGQNGLFGTSNHSSLNPELYMSPYDAGYSVSVPTSLAPEDSSAYSNQGDPMVSFSKSTQHLLEKKNSDYDAQIELVKTLGSSTAEIGADKKTKNLEEYKGPYDFESGDESDSRSKSSIPNKTHVFAAPEATSQDREDSMDIDMEHPDENTIEVGPDQEIIAEAEEKDTTPRKRARFAVAESSGQTAGSTNSPAVGASARAELHKRALLENDLNAGKSPDEDLREYIRAAHGLQLEELSLDKVPLKASILARGIDLNVLKRLTLLSVGPQEPFWLMLTKLQDQPTHISFKSIHTDHVSGPFLQYLRTFEGLEELFLLQRSSKNDPDNNTLRVGINITSIRKFALRRHIQTLKRLMIKNENDESWDMDAKSIRFLSVQGAGLIELAISLNLKNYHLLMQQLPGFKNLVALQFLSLRSSDRSAFLPIESLTFAADTISHLPKLRIKYLALNSHMASIERKPEFVKQYMEMAKERKQKGKGKEKAKTADTNHLDGSSESEDIDDFADITAMETRVRFGISSWEVKDIKIFHKEIRMGKL